MFNDEMNYNLIEKNAEFQREMHKKYVDSVGEKRYLSVQDLILATNQIRLHFFDVNNYSGFTTAKTNVKPNENYNDNYNVNEEVVIPKNKNKRIKNELKLNMPFKSEKFLKSWELLLGTPKWKKKLPATLQLALDKVTEYDEEFVIELIEQATIGNWQGLVFPETKNQYQKWLNGKRLQNQEGRSSNSSNRANNTEIFSE